MSRFTINMSCNANKAPMVEVDGKRLIAKQTSARTCSFCYESDKSTCNVKIYSLCNELVASLWFLRFLYYYLISFFGIFDRTYTKNGFSFAYEADYTLTHDITLDLEINRVSKDARALNSLTPDFIDNDSNIYAFNKRVKRRFALIWTFKILSWILIGLAVVLAIAL